jgi:hypothetical protein
MQIFKIRAKALEKSRLDMYESYKQKNSPTVEASYLAAKKLEETQHWKKN